MKGHADRLRLLFLRGIPIKLGGGGAEFPVIHGLEEPKLLHTKAFT